MNDDLVWRELQRAKEVPKPADAIFDRALAAATSQSVAGTTPGAVRKRSPRYVWVMAGATSVLVAAGLVVWNHGDSPSPSLSADLRPSSVDSAGATGANDVSPSKPESGTISAASGATIHIGGGDQTGSLSAYFGAPTLSEFCNIDSYVDNVIVGTVVSADARVVHDRDDDAIVTDLVVEVSNARTPASGGTVTVQEAGGTVLVSQMRRHLEERFGP